MNKKAFEKTLAWLRGQNVVVYDLEIARLIDEVLPDGRVVKWTTPELMGFACAGLFDYETGDTTIYFERELPRLIERLNRADLIVGFNHIGFDNNLLRKQGHGLKPDAELPNYDILEHTRRGLGWTEGKKFPKGCNLDEHLKAMFGMAKTSNGAEAPKMFQEGRLGELVTYQIADVRRERMVFEHIWLHGTTMTPTNGRALVYHPSRFIRGLHDKGIAEGGPNAGLPGGGAGNDVGTHRAEGDSGGRGAAASGELAAQEGAGAQGRGHLPDPGRPIPGQQGQGAMGHHDPAGGGRQEEAAGQADAQV